MRKILTSLLILGLSFPSFLLAPKEAQAATKTIRQEINITDTYLYAGSGATATSSAIVNLDSTKYSGATYYFEVVASTTAGTSATVLLKNATSSVTIATANVTGGNTYTRYRSSSFTAPGVATNYVVALGGEAIGKGIIASRIVILQSADPLTQTQTQIEIGNNETYTSTATSSLASPKYWKYDSTKWDGTTTFYAEVTYARTVDAILTTLGSTTSYTTNGTFTVVMPTGTASSSIELWGGGGGGGAASTNTNGSGSGGAGGQYAKKTIASLSGTSKTLVVGNFGAGGVSTQAGSTGGDSTWDTNVVVAKGGAGGAANSGTAGAGNTTGCVSDVGKCFAGGNGAAGTSGGVSGGGGEGAGSTSTGGNATNGTGGSGTNGGDGANGQTTNGTPAAATAPGGAGAGGRSTGTPNADGGNGGVGRAIITNDIDVAQNATTTIAVQESDGTGDGFTGWTDKIVIVRASDFMVSTSTRVRSASFTPTTGRNYRLAFKSGYTGATFAIYNAKIVVDQSGPPVSLFDSSLLSDGNLVNYYRLNGDALDYKGAANGTAVGSPAYSTSYSPFSSYQGVFFNNTAGGSTASQYISAAFYAPGANDYTYYAWVKYTSISSNPSEFMHNETNGATGHSHMYFGDDGSNNINTDNSNSAGTVSSVSSTGGDITTGVWYQMAVVRTGGLRTLYINGTDRGSVADSLTLLSVSNGQLGRRLNTTYPNAQRAYAGYLADVATFSRALTEAEIDSLNAGPITKLETQYLLAPFPISGTAAQSLLTSWDSSEWNTTNAYIHQVDAANGSASVVTLIDSTATLVTNSTVTSPDNVGYSSSMCMPSTGDIDVKATTNNGDIYASRIIVQVGGTAASCAVATPPGIPQYFIRKGQLMIINGQLQIR